jgi:ubiquinone/menaquinone biosynthesis C-methylase UbiE
MLDSKQKETSMEITRTTDDEQTTLWNGLAGHAWVALQEVLDQMFKPLEDLLVDAVFAGSGRRVLDVGYGTGSTTRAVARRLGATGRCIGIDISDPMITAARARAARESTPASFLRANAQTHAFAPARFDMIMSRFGVIFFKRS